MSDLTPSGKPVDARRVKIRHRQMEHEISSMKVSILKYEIGMMEAESNIEALQESIEATTARIKEKEIELQQALKAAEEG